MAKKRYVVVGFDDGSMLHPVAVLPRIGRGTALIAADTDWRFVVAADSQDEALIKTQALAISGELSSRPLWRAGR